MNLTSGFSFAPEGGAPGVRVFRRTAAADHAAIDTAARTVIARKGILGHDPSPTLPPRAGRSTHPFYNYYDSKEAMVRSVGMGLPRRSQRGGPVRGTPAWPVQP
ncbi:putative transcriptional regulatory protein [Mycobacterium kansasii 662]|uniref:Putative transcriptional regulatory protein n=1 Tax=Mycobacterium kansasii 662 TaxID=1299326 RepID=X7XQU9_MYCKA|nr:putative transcriptional regulatory protein [Mycobacterium kansasii 662]